MPFDLKEKKQKEIKLYKPSVLIIGYEFNKDFYTN